MYKHLPPLNALRSFEAAARHLSFTLAADELSVTQGAISYQIKKLESRLDITLFERKIRQIKLTETGERLFQVSSRLLQDLDVQLANIVPETSAAIVTVSVSTFFTTRWLSRRLGQFVNQNPHITLQLQHSVNDPEFSIDNVDMAIQWGDGQWSDRCVERLIASPMMALCSPTLLKGNTGLHSLDNLSEHTFLRDQPDNDSWGAWLELARLPQLNNDSNPLILDPNVRVQSAIDGHGLVLGNNLLNPEIEQGLLTEPFDIRLQGMGFYLTYRNDALNRNHNRTFRDWIITQSEKGNLK